MYFGRSSWLAVPFSLTLTTFSPQRIGMKELPNRKQMEFSRRLLHVLPQIKWNDFLFPPDRLR